VSDRREGGSPPSGARSPVAGDSHCSLTSKTPRRRSILVIDAPRAGQTGPGTAALLRRCPSRRETGCPRAEMAVSGSGSRGECLEGEPSPWKKRAARCWQRHGVATDSSAEQRPGVEPAWSASLRRCGKGDSAGVETRTGHVRRALRSRSGVRGRGTTADCDGPSFGMAS
jgi:hypothetical protein